jgi:hypothetical protein
MTTRASLPYPARQSVSIAADIVLPQRPSAESFLGILERSESPNSSTTMQNWLSNA